MSTVKDVSDKFSMSWETVKNIDKKNLEAKFGEVITKLRSAEYGKADQENKDILKGTK
jgi:hypothetical protein